MSNETRTHCANCDHRLSPWDKFCSQCGQDTLNHPPSLWEFIHEWTLHYVAFEGKLWKSLWALIAKPGFLTQEYLAGRKQRYVLPLRLVLTFGRGQSHLQMMKSGGDVMQIKRFLCQSIVLAQGPFVAFFFGESHTDGLRITHVGVEQILPP